MSARLASSLNAACVLAVFVLATPLEVCAQATYEVMPTVNIPKEGYSSWSLFLICNPAWMTTNGDKGIIELFKDYKAFGAAIGPKNLAIWFWTKPAMTPSADLTDVSRSSGYCQKYKLLPSDSPHVLVTTSYPDDPNPGDRFVISLNGLDGQASALALTKLTDQLLVTGLNQSELDASDKWRRVFNATGAALSAVGCYFDKISFSFKTGVLNAEISHTSDNKHC
jgi:hypothetical protein